MFVGVRDLQHANRPSIVIQTKIQIPVAGQRMSRDRDAKLHRGQGGRAIKSEFGSSGQAGTHGVSWVQSNRSTRKGAGSNTGLLPPIRSAMIRPVMGANVTPSMP